MRIREKTKIHNVIKKWTFIGFILAIVFCTARPVFSQQLKISIKISFAKNAVAEIDGKLLSTNSPAASKEISFINSYADVDGLADRIQNPVFFNHDGSPNNGRMLVPGEFETPKPAYGWKYKVKIAPPARITDSAHISWITDDHGILMLADLLPDLAKKEVKGPDAEIDFELPSGWSAVSSEDQRSANKWFVKDIRKAIFLIGRELRTKQSQNAGRALTFSTTGQWQLTDEEAFQGVDSILKEYEKIFGTGTVGRINVILLPFPQGSDPDRWRAETRGSTVTIISGVVPYGSVAIQRLNEQLRHELFHLWLPNSLALTGNYDWFYEGFSIYQALRTGVELNQIRFDDYLGTLGRAYDLTQLEMDVNKVSLVEASKRRWANPGNFIYAKGMIAAFLCDLAFLRVGKGRHEMQNIFREAFKQHKTGSVSQDGTEAILKILGRYKELGSIIGSYINGNSPVTWDTDLKAAGIIVEKEGFRVKLKVVDKPDGRQKDLLDKLGYNQWRKLLQTSK